MKNDLASVLQRLDRRSPDALVRSLAEELARLHGAYALLDARLTAVEVLGKVADRVILASAEAPIDYPTKVKVVAASSFAGQVGFHELEHDDAGKPYRWTGPATKFSFQILVDRSAPAEFGLCFGSIFAGDPIEGITAFVDGRAISLSFRATSDGYVASGVLPPRSDAGETLLTFAAPRVSSPEVIGFADKRMLGLMFRWLIVESIPHQLHSEGVMSDDLVQAIVEPMALTEERADL